MRVKIRLSMAAVVLMAMGALIPSPGIAAASPASPTLVAGGFDSPRGVAFFKGKLVVGEAGHGGNNCIPASATNPRTCFGRTSQISWVNTATKTHTTLVDHLFSVAEYHGPQGEALGVDGISARDGKLMAIEGVFPQAFADYQCAAGDAECAADLTEKLAIHRSKSATPGPAQLDLGEDPGEPAIQAKTPGEELRPTTLILRIDQQVAPLGERGEAGVALGPGR